MDFALNQLKTGTRQFNSTQRIQIYTRFLRLGSEKVNYKQIDEMSNKLMSDLDTDLLANKLQLQNLADIDYQDVIPEYDLIKLICTLLRDCKSLRQNIMNLRRFLINLLQYFKNLDFVYRVSKRIFQTFQLDSQIFKDNQFISGLQTISKFKFLTPVKFFMNFNAQKSIQDTFYSVFGQFANNIKILDHIIVNKPIFTFILLSLVTSSEFELQQRSPEVNLNNVSELLDLAYQIQFKIRGIYDIDVFDNLDRIRNECCPEMRIIDGFIIKDEWSYVFAEPEKQLEKTVFKRQSLCDEYENLKQMQELRKAAQSDLQEQIQNEEWKMEQIKQQQQESQNPLNYQKFKPSKQIIQSKPSIPRPQPKNGSESQIHLNDSKLNVSTKQLQNNQSQSLAQKKLSNSKSQNIDSLAITPELQEKINFRNSLINNLKQQQQQEEQQLHSKLLSIENDFNERQIKKEPAKVIFTKTDATPIYYETEEKEEPVKVEKVKTQQQKFFDRLSQGQKRPKAEQMQEVESKSNQKEIFEKEKMEKENKQNQIKMQIEQRAKELKEKQQAERERIEEEERIEENKRQEEAVQAEIDRQIKEKRIKLMQLTKTMSEATIVHQSKSQSRTDSSQLTNQAFDTKQEKNVQTSEQLSVQSSISSHPTESSKQNAIDSNTTVSTSESLKNKQSTSDPKSKSGLTTSDLQTEIQLDIKKLAEHISSKMQNDPLNSTIIRNIENIQRKELVDVEIGVIESGVSSMGPADCGIIE
ncbi:histone-lysine_N-methyltransferase 2A-like isoform X1 [Hexamita inflata]|uniref:Histone-lysine N-methyltransferase 2A-like isoform X1 n=1 Tax=Hexamita inflata TaxID=28002 RepID=A0AA86PX35_9EUKA|nr:histone-lysine N-methyltransferase 2A-like isoform X1 [Hexamita inflata]